MVRLDQPPLRLDQSALRVDLLGLIRQLLGLPSYQRVQRGDQLVFAQHQFAQTSVHRAKIRHPPMIATRPPTSSHHAANLTTTRAHRLHPAEEVPSTSFAAVITTRSATVGIDSGRYSPGRPGLGICTRRSGDGR
jgi:hypothetical protein